MISAFFKRVGKFRWHYLAYLALFFFVINVAVRLALQIGFPGTLPFSGSMLPGLLKGALNDCAALIFVLLLPATLILLPSDRFLQGRIGKVYAALILFLFAGVFIFTAFAEYFFWDEFSARFNFIAVDYLIYTSEVIQNIVESYPLAWILPAVFFMAAGTTVLMWRRLSNFLPASAARQGSTWVSSRRLNRLGLLAGLYAAAAGFFFLFTPVAGDQNRFWNEYAKNGVYEIFSAYVHNQLDYRAFYKTMDQHKAFALVQGEIKDHDETLEPLQGENLLRMTEAEGPEQKANVIIVLMESIGSRWMEGEYAPNLQALAKKGLYFSNMMSTGTRTVRGIEAVMLSVPPTPGNSIVRRPDNDHLFTLGTVFGEKGYDRDFIYGGLGYFDNMNDFFAGNGYHVTDRLDFDPASQTFANAWGQCDADLYSESLRLADRSFQAGRPFQQVLLTTSNHRPFTFPEGTIDMKQGSRRAAVKYSDYALGKFMDQAREKAWFDNTVFVFVGDHPSSIAGKTEVPPDAYGIACVMYGPKFFAPQKVDTLCSQIDVGPTLLASLGWEYSSQFFGTDARDLTKDQGRAWISTYQLLGFRSNDRLVVLKPDASAEVTRLAQRMPGRQPDALGEAKDKAMVARAVASYQCAYDLFTSKKMKEKVVIAYASTPGATGQRAVIDRAGIDEASWRSIHRPTSKPKAGLLGLLFMAGHMDRLM